MTISQTIRRNVIAGLVVCVLAAPVFSFRKVEHYPAIKALSKTAFILPSSLEFSETLTVLDAKHRPAYELSLIAISLDNRSTDSIHLFLSTTGKYSPDPEEKHEPNLLNPDYWGHGEGAVIRPEEIFQARGGKRDFYLRKMHIAIRLSEVKLSSDFCSLDRCEDQVGGITRMRLTITVTPSKTNRRRPT